MIYKTRGIVLHHIKYSETSVIAKIYTELFGLQSYLINGVRRQKAKVKANLLQPLSLVDMIVYHKEKKGLQRIRDVSGNPPLSSIPYDFPKSSVALFIAEILYKSIREEEANTNLFEFLFHSIQKLDITTGNCANFHLFFMLQLTKYLGFYPNRKYSGKFNFFDLREGVFSEKQPEHPNFISPPLCVYIDMLSETSFEKLNQISISPEHRKRLLEHLIEYYELHLPNMKNIKSHLVLETIMNDMLA